MKRISFPALALILALVLSLFAAALIPQVAQAQTWPTSWIQISTDKDEDGTADDPRDVATAWYSYDADYLYLRLCARAAPDLTNVTSRFKWFFDLGQGNPLSISGGSVVGAEYMLFVEDTGGDGAIEVYLLNAGGDESFSEYEPTVYQTTPGPVTNTTIAGYRIDGWCVDMYIKLSALGVSSPYGISLLWATDQQNPNLEQMPTTDKPDDGQPITLSPAIEVYKTDSPDPVQAGQNITYTVTITNDGNMDVINGTGNEFEDPIPADTSYAPGTITVDGVPNDDDITDGIGYDSGNTQIIWNGAVPAGGSVTIVFQVTVDSPLANGTQISNQGTFYWDSASEPSDDPLTPDVDDDPTITTVHSAPVLMISKGDYPDPVKPGETLTYTIFYENTGNEVATNVVITETYDSNVAFDSATPPVDVGNNIWIIGSLSPADGQKTITINVTVNSPLADGTILNNYVNITCDEGVFDDDSEETTVNSTAVLILSKADSPDPVPAGDILTYTLTYENTGTANATGTVITDILPDEVTFLSASPSPDTSDGILTWNIGELAPDGPHIITINVTVKSPIANGTVITNNVTITCSLGICSEAEQTTVISAPILDIEKTDSPDPVEAGGTLTYVITVNNTGNANATGVSIIDDYDQTKLTITDADGGTDNGDAITWDGGISIPGQGGSVSYTVTATVASPLEDGILVFNNVTASCEQGVTASATETTTVSSAPALTINKTDSPDPVEAGGTLTYVITVNNTGNANATGVSIIDDYDQTKLTITDADGGVDDGDTITWDGGISIPGQGGSVSYTVTATVASPLEDGILIFNPVSVSCEQGVTASTTENTTVGSAPALTITKTDSPDPVEAGGTLTYSITVTNTGNANATGGQYYRRL
jgi:uncharacterized repeat protein (TIGR01451 family)